MVGVVVMGLVGRRSGPPETTPSVGGSVPVLIEVAMDTAVLMDESSLGVGDVYPKVIGGQPDVPSTLLLPMIYVLLLLVVVLPPPCMAKRDASFGNADSSNPPPPPHPTSSPSPTPSPPASLPRRCCCSTIIISTTSPSPKFNSNPLVSKMISGYKTPKALRAASCCAIFFVPPRPRPSSWFCIHTPITNSWEGGDIGVIGDAVPAVIDVVVAGGGIDGSSDIVDNVEVDSVEG